MSESEINSICRKFQISNYTIHDDMSISVDGSVSLSRYGLSKIPLKFRGVTGDFYCTNNNLISLEGSPVIGNGFYCSRNRLTSLEFFPKYFEPPGIFPRVSCHSNNITNFDGLPEFFESDIDIFSNPVYEVYSLFNEPTQNRSDPKCIYYIREFDVIQGNRIIKDRLEEVYVHMGLKMPINLKFMEYVLV